MPTRISYKNKNGVEIDFELKVYTRPNLRDDTMAYLGKPYLENLFDTRLVDDTVIDMHIEYPERWTNILEQRAIVNRIPKLYPNIEKVTITTHSVFIIQCVDSQSIRIYDNPDLYPDQSDSLNLDYCPRPEKMSLIIFTP